MISFDIVSVEYLDEVDVYDLHIDHVDHSYHVNNIPVHNSGYCRNHDGRIYNQPIEEIQHLMHTHFRCRSQFIATPNFSKSDTRASQFGAVKNESYEKWYLQQDDTFHKSTLANRQYNAFLKGHYKVNSLADLTKKNGLGAIAKELNR